MSENQYAEREINGEILKGALNYYFGNIMITDGSGNIIYANESMLKLYNISRDKAMTASVYDLVEQGQISRSACAEAIKEKKTITRLLETELGANVGCIANPIISENGEVEMVVIYSQDEHFVNEVIRQVEVEKEKNKNIRRTIDYLQQNDERSMGVVVSDLRMKELYRAMKTIAKTDSTIMIYGESGTGKEVVARYVHRNSNRNKEIFIPINCAAIPSELMESEFFGYERGAFTGANKEGKAGLFEMADKGTIFLDELGELPLAMQTKLLRVLESGEVKRIGSSKTIYTDVRIVAATNRNLMKMVNEKSFREDLFYRLNVIPVTIPPLRERPDDIEALIHYFLGKYNKKYDLNKYISPELIKAFKKYAWPGNIRELKNEIERLVIISNSNSDIIDFGLGNINTLSDFQAAPKFISDTAIPENQITDITGEPLKKAVEDFEKKYILGILSICKNKVSDAAEVLGIHRSVLYRKLEKYEIKLER